MALKRVLKRFEKSAGKPMIDKVERITITFESDDYTQQDQRSQSQGLLV